MGSYRLYPILSRRPTHSPWKEHSQSVKKSIMMLNTGLTVQEIEEIRILILLKDFK